jgi:hypothetical protein
VAQVSAVTQAEKTVLSPRVERGLDVADRGFPLVWLCVYALLPTSGWAGVMFASWHDQELFLETLRSVLVNGRADAIDDNLVGPAYVALAALFHWVFGLGAQDALVALNRASYALSVASALVLVRVLVRRLTSAPPLASLAAQLVLVGFVVGAGTWHWSDVPWSHFVATFLAVLFLAARYAPARTSTATAALVGAALALLVLTRSFEAAALLAAWGVSLGLVALLRLSRPRVPRPAHLVSGAGAFLAAAVAVQLITGKRGLFFLYGGNVDEGGNLLPTESAETPTFSLAFVPTKLVQLFYEPCYDAMCSLSDYVGGSRALSGPLAEAAGNERLWRLPLAVQLPSLVLLPVCLVAVGALLVWFVRNRAKAAGRVRELRLLLELTIAATGIVLGYVASTISGSPHLRYGLVRDFLLPALLTSVAAAGLLGAGLWLALSRIGPIRVPPTTIRLSTETVLVVLAFVLSVGIVTGAAVARSQGLPRIESRKLGPVEYTATCRGSSCDVDVAAVTVSGNSISIPEPSTLTFGCGSDTPRFTLYTEDLSVGVQVPASCRDPRLVAAWPTVMGLPPGSYELGFVDVANVRP